MDRRHWVTITWLLLLLATLLHTAGYSAPMWLWLQSSDGAEFYGIGFWYHVGCTNAECLPTNASLGETRSDPIFAEVGFQAVRGLETVGLAGCCLLLICGMVYRIGFDKWTMMKTLNSAIFLIAVLTELVILAGLIVFAVLYSQWLKNSSSVSSRSFPWSFIMCIIAFLVLFIACLLLRTKAKEHRYINNAIPMSGDAKMDLNPLTKTAMTQRYFTPSPYSEDRRTTIDQSAYYDDSYDKPAYSFSNFENKAYVRNQVDSVPLVSNVGHSFENRGYISTDEFRRRSYSGPDNYLTATNNYQVSNRMDISADTDYYTRPRPKSIAVDAVYPGHDVSYYRDPVKPEPIHYEERVVTRIERVPVYGSATSPPMTGREIGTKYLGHGRVQALSDYEDPRCNQFERYTVHTRQKPAYSGTRLISDARTTNDPTMGDGFANGSIYMYRPYQPQKY